MGGKIWNLKYYCAHYDGDQNLEKKKNSQNRNVGNFGTTIRMPKSHGSRSGNTNKTTSSAWRGVRLELRILEIGLRFETKAWNNCFHDRRNNHCLKIVRTTGKNSGEAQGS